MNFIIKYFNKLIPKNIPIGRWQIPHLHNNKNANYITERKIDLANLDSCFCNEITKCINKNKK